MSLRDGLEWAYPGTSQVCCIREVGAEVMLCGLFFAPAGKVGFCPVEQPQRFPSPLCGRCVEIVFGEPQ